jgi:flavin-dependent dehydrogenase
MNTLIVGFGIAGLSIAHQLRRNKISFHVIDSSENSSSLVAGGVLNPTVLKRYNMSW